MLIQFELTDEEDEEFVDKGCLKIDRDEQSKILR